MLFSPVLIRQGVVPAFKYDMSVPILHHILTCRAFLRTDQWERLQLATGPILEHRLGPFGAMQQDESSDDESVEQILVDLR